MSLQSDSQDAESAIELAPVRQNEGMADAQDQIVSATQDDENSATGNCFVRVFHSLLSFLDRFGWVAKWVTLFLAVWTTIDMLLDGRQTHVFKTNSPDWNPQGFHNNTTFCDETILKACWEDLNSRECDGAVFMNDLNVMQLNCELRLNAAYFELSLACWMTPPLLFATAWVWIKFGTEVSLKSKNSSSCISLQLLLAIG